MALLELGNRKDEVSIIQQRVKYVQSNAPRWKGVVSREASITTRQLSLSGGAEGRIAVGTRWFPGKRAGLADSGVCARERRRFERIGGKNGRF